MIALLPEEEAELHHLQSRSAAGEDDSPSFTLDCSDFLLRTFEKREPCNTGRELARTVLYDLQAVQHRQLGASMTEHEEAQFARIPDLLDRALDLVR